MCRTWTISAQIRFPWGNKAHKMSRANRGIPQWRIRTLSFFSFQFICGFVLRMHVMVNEKGNTFMDYYRSPIRLTDCHSQTQAFLDQTLDKKLCDVILVHKCRFHSILSYISAADLSRFQIQIHIQKVFIYFANLNFFIVYQIKTFSLKL